MLGDLKKKNREFLSLHDAFQDLFLDKRGIHAQKEHLEKSIHAMDQELSACQNNITQLEGEKKTLTLKETRGVEKMGELNTRLGRLTADADAYAATLENHRQQVKEYDDQIAGFRQIIARAEQEIAGAQVQIKASQKEYDETDGQIKRMTRTLTSHDQDLEGMNERIQQTGDRIKAKRSQLKEQEERSGQLKLDVKELETKRGDLKTLLIENYGVNVEETVKKVTDRTDLSVIRQQIQKLKEARNELGPANPLAIEEYKEFNERFHFLQKQKADIEKAETEALEALKMLDEESRKMFLATFKIIREHYIHITRKLFRGGKADLVLLAPDDPLNSDIEIIVQPPGKKTKLSQLSGGEKALSAISLIFSIFLTRPSPFCVMDEVDAPLDDQNIMRFVSLMKDFTERVQFLLVTHNKQTMAAADLIYGVTMEEPAVSKIVSLQFNGIDKDKYQIKDLADKEFTASGTGDGRSGEPDAPPSGPEEEAGGK
jgi:chromosome segregation protein